MGAPDPFGDSYDVVIIGGGLAGLTAGALLSLAVPAGREGFLDAHLRQFPDEGDGLRRAHRFPSTEWGNR